MFHEVFGWEIVLHQLGKGSCHSELTCSLSKHLLELNVDLSLSYCPFQIPCNYSRSISELDPRCHQNLLYHLVPPRVTALSRAKLRFTREHHQHFNSMIIINSYEQLAIHFLTSEICSIAASFYQHISQTLPVHQLSYVASTATLIYSVNPYYQPLSNWI